MIQEALNEIAKKIIRKNKYLTLATTDGEPWAAPLYYAVDDQWNFYFISPSQSLHTRHIAKHSRVAFAIFDSHQEEGQGNCVQGSGTVRLLGDHELDEAFRWYRTTYVEMKKESFTGSAPYRLFKLTPEHFYVLDLEAKTDTRVEAFIDR